MAEMNEIEAIEAVTREQVKSQNLYDVVEVVKAKRRIAALVNSPPAPAVVSSIQFRSSPVLHRDGNFVQAGNGRLIYSPT